MTIDKYYGLRKLGTTHLDFYSRKQENNEPVILKTLKDQDAYDTWHLAQYFREILECRCLLEKEHLNFEELPRKERNIFLFMLLETCPHLMKIVELGSSLFELIDGLELSLKYFKSTGYANDKIDIKNLEFTGIEISPLLSLGSKILHSQYNIKLHSDCNDMTGGGDLLWDRMVSSYIFTTAKDLADFINLFKVGWLDLAVSKEGSFVASAVGKTFTYFSLQELIYHLNKPLYHLFGYKNPTVDMSMGRQVVEGFFLNCSEDFATKFIETSNQIPIVKSYFNKKSVRLRKAADLLCE